MKIHLAPHDDYLGATNVWVADSILVGCGVGLSGTMGDVVGDDGVAGGKKGKLHLLRRFSWCRGGIPVSFRDVTFVLSGCFLGAVWAA